MNRNTCFITAAQSVALEQGFAEMRVHMVSKVMASFLLVVCTSQLLLSPFCLAKVARMSWAPFSIVSL